MRAPCNAPGPVASASDLAQAAVDWRMATVFRNVGETYADNPAMRSVYLGMARSAYRDARRAGYTPKGT